MKIETRATDDLRAYERNARTHSDEQIAQIAASIAEFGFTNPILIGADDVIIAGHGRLLAAQRLGMAEVPTIVLDHLTDAQRRALVIADNRIAENAGWDEELLRAELEALDELEFDLNLIGFSDAELDELLDDVEAPALGGAVEGEDEVPEPPAEPVSEPGDLWILGNHRLLCGDATVATDVERLLGTVKPLLMVTDPPYGVDVRPGLAEQGRRGGDEADRQGAERRPRRLARGLGALPGRRRLRLARRAARHDGGREPDRLGLRDPLADHLGEGSPGAEPGRLPLAARALLVRRAEERQGALGRRPEADDALAHRQQGPGRGDGARHAEAGRGDAAADAQQLEPRAGDLRAVHGLGHDADRGRDGAAGSASGWS